MVGITPSRMYTTSLEELEAPDAYCNYKYESASLKSRANWLVGCKIWVNKTKSGSLLFLANNHPTEKSSIQRAHKHKFHIWTELLKHKDFYFFCKLKMLHLTLFYLLNFIPYLKHSFGRIKRFPQLFIFYFKKYFSKFPLHFNYFSIH